MRRLLLLLTICTAFACTEKGGPITIDDRTGTVRGFAYVDRNADLSYAAGTDELARGVSVALLLDATGDTVAATITDNDGRYSLTNVPIGRYEAVGALGALGDTVEVQEIDTPIFSLSYDDTVTRNVRIGYPRVTTASVRSSPVGRRIVIEGVALNAWGAFGDQTVHIEDEYGAIRATGVGQVSLQAGDSIRLLGTVAVSGGQPVIGGGSVIVTRAGIGLGPADSVSTMVAATARADSLDAARVFVAGSIVAAQAAPNGDTVLGVDDGSGILEVVLDATLPFSTAQFQPGALIRATGVLVPAAVDTWQLKPAATADAIATFPTVTIADARALDVGRTVFIQGIALNALVTFGDNTVHIADATGVIRTLGVPQVTIFARDSISVLGMIAMQNGQPVLEVSSASVLLTDVRMPAIDSVSTAIAATADGGSRDAGHVAVSGEITARVNRQGGDVALTIDDGSGPVIVVLDTSVGIATGNYIVGAVIRARGLLVPDATGTQWELKPRSASEIAIQP